ncbi:MAG TPA: PspC domain-containing protein [Acidimicrobiales bacterium]|jgi:phage shock protein PspC (stress-responsive transcriptional regulator)
MEDATPDTASEQAQILRRPHAGRMLAGVAAGIAEHLDLDVTLVRIVLVVLAFVGGLAVPLYLAAWLLIPDEDADVSVAEDLIDQFRAR